MPKSQTYADYASNLSLRVLRAMRLCSVVASDARLAYVRAFCAFHTLRGNSHRKHVAEMMLVILQDHHAQYCYLPAPAGGTVLERATKAVEEDLRGEIFAAMKE